MDVAGQPVALGDDERGLAFPAQLDGFVELRPVGVQLAGFDLGELGEQGSGPTKRETA